MWKWLGAGFVPGIPARDLTDEEVAMYGTERVRATGLYEEVKPKQKPSASEDKAIRTKREDK